MLNKLIQVVKFLLLSLQIVLYFSQTVYAGMVTPDNIKRKQDFVSDKKSKSITNSLTTQSQPTLLAVVKKIMANWSQPSESELLLDHLKEVPNQLLTRNDTTLNLGTATSAAYVTSLDGLRFILNQCSQMKKSPSRCLIILNDELVESLTLNIVKNNSSGLLFTNQISEDEDVFFCIQEKQFLANLQLKPNHAQNLLSVVVVSKISGMIRNMAEVLKNPIIAVNSFLVTPVLATTPSTGFVGALSGICGFIALCFCCFGLGVVYQSCKKCKETQDELNQISLPI